MASALLSEALQWHRPVLGYGWRIQTIYSVANPDKLGQVGPVADAGVVARGKADSLARD